MRAAIALLAVLSLTACGERSEKELVAAAPGEPARVELVEPPAAVRPDAYRGSAIAQQVCVQCHDVGVEGLAPKMQVGAPAFREIANGDGMTASRLAEWMGKSHPAMPNFIFDEPSVAALSAYIMSLRTPS